jgi:hypothetical protein
VLKQNYRSNKNNSPNEDVKKLAILFLIVLVLAVISNIISHLDFSDSNNDENIDITSFEDIKSVLEFYNCEYISEGKSSEEGYSIDVYAKLSKMPYDGDDSNESFYTRLINLSSSVLNFVNYRIIDNENDIIIAVECEDGKIQKIFINGIEDYFTYMASQISLKEYKEIPETEISIDSQELNLLVKANWSQNFVNLGNSDGNFQSYEEYFDKGVKIRKINGKIYNIVFDKNYTNAVICGIMVGEGFDVAKYKLGTPTFEDTANKIYGYKSENFYVFFTENEISIYRRENSIDYSEFIELVNKLSNEELDINEFMNELTYLWSDYSEYTVGEDYFYITYPIEGVGVKCNYENTNAIILYNNCKMEQKQIATCLNLPECLAQMQVDNVFEAEKTRVSKVNSLLQKCEDFIEENKTEENQLINNIYGIYADRDLEGNIKSMYFISKDATRVNREIIDYIDTFAWLNDTIFIYSVPQKGIYYYNLDNNKRGTLLSGKEDYKIISCNNYLLKYDNEEIHIDL